MVSAFLGTNTGNTYVAGHVYERAGEKYRAEADGSFTNLRTGRSSVGSSVQVEAYEREQVRREVEAAMQAELRGTGPGRASVGAARATGAGVGGVGSAVTIGPGAGRAVAPAGPTFFPLKVEVQPSSRTPIVIGGYQIVQDVGWSDAGDFEQRYGEGEFGSPSWFAGWGVAIADGVAMYNASNAASAREVEALKARGEYPVLPGTAMANPPLDSWPPPPSDVFVLSSQPYRNTYTGNEPGIPVRGFY